jgi:hypothetical protein
MVSIEDGSPRVAVSGLPRHTTAIGAVFSLAAPGPARCRVGSSLPRTTPHGKCWAAGRPLPARPARTVRSPALVCEGKSATPRPTLAPAAQNRARGQSRPNIPSPLITGEFPLWKRSFVYSLLKRTADWQLPVYKLRKSDSRPGLPTGSELVLPPVELTLFQPALPTKLPNRCPALRRLTDRPLPITCLLRVTLSAVAHPTPSRLIHACALDACPGYHLSEVSGRNFNQGRWVRRTDTTL